MEVISAKIARSHQCNNINITDFYEADYDENIEPRIEELLKKHGFRTEIEKQIDIEYDDELIENEYNIKEETEEVFVNSSNGFEQIDLNSDGKLFNPYFKSLQKSIQQEILEAPNFKKLHKNNSNEHTDIKKYSCHFCMQVFQHDKTLKVHIQYSISMKVIMRCVLKT